MENYGPQLRDMRGGFSLNENSNPFRGAEVCGLVASCALGLDGGEPEALRRRPVVRLSSFSWILRSRRSSCWRLALIALLLISQDGGNCAVLELVDDSDNWNIRKAERAKNRLLVAAGCQVGGGG